MSKCCGDYNYNGDCCDKPQKSDQQFPETNRREAAVRLLLSQGWKWDGKGWYRDGERLSC